MVRRLLANGFAQIAMPLLVLGEEAWSSGFGTGDGGYAGCLAGRAASRLGGGWWSEAVAARGVALWAERTREDF